MSEHTELINRLRTYRGGYFHEHDCHGAANVIEQLEAALRASTGWLRQCYLLMPESIFPESRYEINNQISANEAVLGGKHDTDQK